MKESGQQFEGQRLQYTRSLCKAAFNNMFYRDVFKKLRLYYTTSVNADEDVKHLFAAATHVDDSILVERLLKAGADVNAWSKYFGRALNVAASKGNVDTVSLLLEHGANVGGSGSPCPTDYRILSLRVSCTTGLEAAAIAGHENIVRLMLDPKYHAITSGHDYESAILNAVRGGHISLMLSMMKDGQIAHPTHLRELILAEACQHGHEEIVRLMLDAGITPNCIDGPGENVLKYAASQGSQNIVNLLLARGANPDGVGIRAILNPLNEAVNGKNMEVAQTLLDHDADINAGYGSRLHIAALQGNLHMLRFLLKRGAALETESQPSDTALAGAVRRGYEPVVRMLVEHGANIGDSEYGEDNRAMLTALQYGQDHVVKTLIELGAKAIDPFKCKYAAEFASGKYPVRISPRERFFL